jgi:hypothetical protein
MAEDECRDREATRLRKCRQLPGPAQCSKDEATGNTWRLGVSIREYREFEADTRWPTSETWHAICELYGWPQTFVVAGRRGAI